MTLATVQERVGLSYAAAARALPRLRGERIADLLQDEPDLNPEEATKRLGYPTAVHRTALARAVTELGGRQVLRARQGAEESESSWTTQGAPAPEPDRSGPGRGSVSRAAGGEPAAGGAMAGGAGGQGAAGGSSCTVGDR
ncbi:hypothetical protein [Streptomyces sp. IMTB 2501]|uniref:hypothetical protein n=1 Tax=Streptomyces sp. IMTB 2501 TaxID=1776340 RepID=UPI0021166DBA|nr:hypothetical protein [Streptomyces sp. IMTB 2501]